MNRIKDIRKPPPSLVKLIECIGVLLFIPITKKKSNYKITLPSNYDDTIDALLKQFDECLVKINQLESSQIENETAAILYNKILDPSFIYEDAINAGGLIARDFFSSILLTLQKLQADPNRLPTVIQNILVLVDGSRASMVALDTAAHVWKHGTLHVFADNMLLTSPNSPRSMAENVHLMKIDIQRRCQSHFKIPEHCYQIHGRFQYDDGYGTNAGELDNSMSMMSPPYNSSTPAMMRSGTVSPNNNNTRTGTTTSKQNNATTPVGEELMFQTSSDLFQQLLVIKQNLSDLSEMYDCSTLVIGLNNSYDFDLSSKDSLPYWAVWDYSGDTIVTKGISYVRPFTEVHCPRSFLLYLNPELFQNNLVHPHNHQHNNKNDEIISYFDEEKLQAYFIQSLQYCRPGDTIIVFSVFPTLDPLGDNDYETRYEFGGKHLWMKNANQLAYEPNAENWNDNIVMNYMNVMNNLIAKSFLNGKVVVERLPKKNYPGMPNILQLMNQVALQENVQGIILSKRSEHKTEEMIKQCIRDYPFTLLLLK
jgi:hypothetical protein